MREIKFRGLQTNIEDPKWLYGSLVTGLFHNINTKEDCAIILDPSDKPDFDCIADLDDIGLDVDIKSVGQYTGIKDKNSKEIYEGDIIQYHEIYRSTQTHYGDNIPNGAYTEPMEPEIRTVVSEVVFRDGAFIIDTERVKSWGDGYEDIVFPLAWCINNPDEESIKTSIEYRKSDADMWDDPEEGDLQYLLETYNLPDLQALIDHCTGIEIIGNIYQNPELL